MASFPTLPSGNTLDSQKYSVTFLDDTLSKDVEGGYTYTRPRTTRRARKAFGLGFTFITEADRIVLANFYTTTTKGGSIIFSWTSPQDGATYSVRFKGNLKFDYVGAGATQAWNCSFELVEA